MENLAFMPKMPPVNPASVNGDSSVSTRLVPNCVTLFILINQEKVFDRGGFRFLLGFLLLYPIYRRVGPVEKNTYLPALFV